MKEVFEKYKTNIEESLNKWMVDNGYQPITLTEDIIKDLLDELLCFLCSPSDLGFVMDEIDKDMLLSEYSWCKSSE